MKKLIVLVLMVMIGIGLFVVKAKADSSNYPYYNPIRTIVRQTIGATSNSVLVGHAVVVYKVSGYATSAAEIFGLYDTISLSSVTASNVKLEGGQATQYNAIANGGFIDFGDEGLVFNTGLTVIVSNGSIIVEYA